MSTPTGDNAFLHALELNVRTELTLAETSQPWEEAVRVPIDEWLSDPADDQRYEVGPLPSRRGRGPGRRLEPRRGSFAGRSAGERHYDGAFAQRARTEHR